MGLGVVHRTPQDLRQLSMTEGFNASTKIHLDKAWASAFYEANIPFNIIRHPAFIYAKETTKHWMLAYTPPSYNAVRTSLLKAKKEEVERKTTTQLGDSLHKYGVTLCADGWDNVQNRPLLNIIQTGTRGDLFLGTIDTTESIRMFNTLLNKSAHLWLKWGPTILSRFVLTMQLQWQMWVVR
jgi:hypothetical protein